MRNGFTLVELLFVGIILSVLSGMVISVWKRPPIDTAARELSSVLLAAQTRAVLEQADVELQFDTVLGRLTLIERPGSTGERRTVPWEMPDGVQFGRLPAPALPMGDGAVTFGSALGGLPALRFHRGGSASEWGGFYLRSRRSGLGHANEVRALEVDRGTGRVTLWRHRRDGWVPR